MHIERIDLNLLVVLDAIFTEGGVTGAARKLHVTQPALSHALARLRELFGDPLFERTGRAMTPTPRARQLIEPVRRALRELQVGLNQLQAFDPATATRSYTIGVRDVLESAVLTPLLQRIHRHAPGIDITAVRVDRRRLEAELSSGALDAALDVLLPVADRLRHRHLSSDRLVVVLRQRHPLAQRTLTMPAYLQQQHVLVSSRRSGPALEDLELARRGMQRRIRLRCQHYFTACRVVHDTDLVLTMPAQLADVTNRSFKNAIRPFPIASPKLDAYLYWHANVDADPANRWLREQIAEVVA
jgi:DNA-binding transcriptional LysR family regulator